MNWTLDSRTSTKTSKLTYIVLCWQGRCRRQPEWCTIVPADRDGRVIWTAREAAPGQRVGVCLLALLWNHSLVAIWPRSTCATRKPGSAELIIKTVLHPVTCTALTPELLAPTPEDYCVFGAKVVPSRVESILKVPWCKSNWRAEWKRTDLSTESSKQVPRSAPNACSCHSS